MYITNVDPRDTQPEGFTEQQTAGLRIHPQAIVEWEPGILH